MKNIVLCGFMGCGKTTAGSKAARMTGREFVDMDQYIETSAEMSVAEIFDRGGEEEFRRLEAEACRQLSRKQGAIIATGGGALTFEENRKAFEGNSVVVYLECPLPVLLKRLSGDSTRPLLRQGPEKVAALYRSRVEAYRRAAQVVISAEGSPALVAQAIAELIKVQK